MIEFRLLGPVEALRGGSTLPLGGPRQRALLALLLREPGRPVSAEHLVEELWHGRAPAGAATTLRSYVSKLRTVLEAGAPLVATPGAYALDVARETVDAHRFERLTKEGEEALARRRAQRAGDVFREALELWRGRAFDGLADDGVLRLEAERLDQLRLLALEQRIEADLALGASGELVEEIEALVREHPYRERLWRQLMLALYRAERQADALAAYRHARTLLDGLGLEPSEELRELERSILRHDVPPALVPEQRHNLPAPLTSFVGREAELVDIERLLEDARLVTLTGVGGAGKTRLALETAARAVPHCPDGVFFVDFSGLARPRARRGGGGVGARLRRADGLERRRALGGAPARRRSSPRPRQLRAPARAVRGARPGIARSLSAAARSRHEPRAAGRAGRGRLRGAAAGPAAARRRPG